MLTGHGGAPISDTMAWGVQLLARALEGDAELELEWGELEEQLHGSDGPLGQLIERFELTRFETQCVLLSLSRYLHPRLAAVMRRASEDLDARGVSVGLALQLFCELPEERVEAHRVFLAGAPLLRHGIIRLGESLLDMPEGLIDRRFELTAPARCFLLAQDDLSEHASRWGRLERATIALSDVILPTRHLENVRELVTDHTGFRETLTRWCLHHVVPYGRGLTFLFSGPSGTGKTLLAQAVAAYADRPLLSVSALDIPAQEGYGAILADLFTEAAIRDAVLLFDECEALFGRGEARRALALRAIESFGGIVVLTTNRPSELDDALARRIVYHVPFELPTTAMRRQIWEVHVPPTVPLTDDIDLDALSDIYEFSGGTIKNAVLVATNFAVTRNRAEPRLSQALLEEACQTQLRYALEDLTVRTTTHLRLEDIVLPEETMREIRELLGACRCRTAVMNRWGFGERLLTGKGIAALLDGPPGTGKTYCAEILAGELGTPLHRVNLPEVVSKWVGETEKRIQEIFQQARLGRAMLLFDEADALFGARTADPKGSNDRYANMTVNLLLQEIERFPGVTVLTTNHYGSLDKALLRRLQFRVRFEEPSVEQRQRIWQVLCPARAELASDVDFARLARRFELTGGLVKNALLRAAYRAMSGGGPITMTHLVEACEDTCKADGRLPRMVRPKVAASPPAGSASSA